MLSPNQISQETVDRSKQFMREVVGDASEFEDKEWWCGQFGLVSLVINWVENEEHGNGNHMEEKTMAASPREIAEEITDYLFVSKYPQETATRLVLERPDHELEGTGWCREAVRDAIIDRLEALKGKPVKTPTGIGEILASTVEIDGATYEPEHDQKRLTNLAKRVKTLMLDGKWRTLAEIKAVTGGGEASISARLRDLRKPKHGGYPVDSRRRGDPKSGLFEYRVRQRT